MNILPDLPSLDFIVKALALTAGTIVITLVVRRLRKRHHKNRAAKALENSTDE